MKDFNDILVRIFNSALKHEEEVLCHSSSHPLSISEIHTLAEIGLGKSKTMTEVAAGLKISLGALTAAINKLVTKGYVIRLGVPEDRRIVKISLTDAGAEAVSAHEDYHKHLVESATEEFSAEQRESMRKLLEKLYEFFRTPSIKPIRDEDLRLKPIRIGNIDIQKPIFQGDLGTAFSSPRLCAAIASCGGVGLISAANPGFDEEDFAVNRAAANIRAFKRNISQAQKLLYGKGGGIAAGMICMSADYEKLVKAAVESGIKIITAGAGVPLSLPALVGGAGVKLIPIVSSARGIAVIRRSWAKKYNRTPDAVIFEGPGKSGHLGFREEELARAGDGFYQAVLEIKHELADMPDCPLIVANGHMSSEEVRKVVAYGADGIQLEEEFALTAECAVGDGLRDVYRGHEGDSVIVGSPLGMPVRILRNGLAERILEGSAARNSGDALTERIPEGSAARNSGDALTGRIPGGSAARLSGDALTGRIPESSAARDSGDALTERCNGCFVSCLKAGRPFCLAEALAAAARGDVDNGVFFRAAGSVYGDGSMSMRRDIVSVQDIFDDIFNG